MFRRAAEGLRIQQRAERTAVAGAPAKQLAVPDAAGDDLGAVRREHRRGPARMAAEEGRQWRGGIGEAPHDRFFHALDEQPLAIEESNRPRVGEVRQRRPELLTALAIEDPDAVVGEVGDRDPSAVRTHGHAADVREAADHRSLQHARLDVDELDVIGMHERERGVVRGERTGHTAELCDQAPGVGVPDERSGVAETAGRDPPTVRAHA